MKKAYGCRCFMFRERKEDRITLTLPVINNSRMCMFLVSGAEKHKALAEVLNLLKGADPACPACAPAGWRSGLDCG